MRYCFLKELIRKKVNANEWSVEEVQRFGGFVSKKYPKNLGKWFIIDWKEGHFESKLKRISDWIWCPAFPPFFTLAIHPFW